MKSLHTLYSLFFCLLFCSAINADNSEQNPFDFLEIPLENATMVESGLALTENIGGVSLSTLINTGLWWGVCKMPGMIFALANKHQLTEPGKTSLEQVKADFCLQLAPLVAATETTLAGQVSPWPLEPLWWRPIFWSGAALSAYSGYKLSGNGQGIPVAVMTFLTTGALSRTLSSATSTSIMKGAGIKNIDDAYYKLGEYVILAMITGVVTNSIIYQALRHKNASPVKTAFISAVAAIVAGMLSGSISVANIDFNNTQSKDIYIATIATAGALAGAGAGAGAAAGAGIVVGAGAEAGAIAVAVAVAVAVAGAGAGAAAGAGIVAGAVVGAVAVAGAVTVAIAGAGAGAEAITSINRLAQKKPALAITAAVVSATVFALINSLSDYAVYGHPLEQGLSETSETLWKKFYAPLDYLSTLFQ